MTLAVLARQPYADILQMDSRELETLELVLRSINKAKGAKRGGK